MNEHFPLSVLRRLNDAGYQAWFVGGCVRDMLLGVPPKDFDLTTSALPEQVCKVFSSERVIPTGLKHGTVTVLLDGQPIEVTTYRVDGSYSDNRHPDSVRFTDQLRDDLARRDFTVNAMAWHPDHGLADYFGGQADLRAGMIRCVGVPDARFGEDALRILRALRFASVLGFQVAPETAASVRRNRRLLDNVSRERVSAELLKLLCGENVFQILMQFPEVLCVPLPELLPCLGFEQRNPHHCFDVYTHLIHTVKETPAEPSLRLAALLHDIGKPACFSLDARGVGHFYGHGEESARQTQLIVERLRLDRATAERVVTLVRWHDAPILPPEERTVKRALRKYTPEAFFPLMAIKRADNLAQHPDWRGRQREYDRIETIAREILAREDCFSLKDLAVNGKDLIALGMRPGPALGKTLNDLLEAVISGRVENTREALFGELKMEN